MNVGSATLVPARLIAPEARLTLPNIADGGERFAIGQIIKGRVLRHFDGGRYLVTFDGHERVVDSSVPLKTGELIRGRVVAIGDRVEVERLRESDAASVRVQRDDSQVDAGEPVRGLPDEIEAAFARYRAPVESDSRGELARALRAAPDRDAMMLAGITLSKLGLPQNSTLLGALYQALTRSPALAAAAVHGGSSPTLGLALGAQIREMLRAAVPTAETHSAAAVTDGQKPLSGAADSQQQPTNTGRGRADSGQLGSWLLNAQTGGSVAHRVGTLPLLVGGRLVEVDIALFEQARERARVTEARHRHLVFVLNTERLGRIEVSAKLADARVRLRIASDRAHATQVLSDSAGALRATLTDLGWSVDEVVYETRDTAGGNAVARAVIEHVIAQDSVNQLV